MSDPILPPAAGSWWDATATLAAVLQTLRLEAADVDEDRIEAAIAAAADMIDQYLDSAEGVTVSAAPLQLALEQLAVELYQRKPDEAITPSLGLPSGDAFDLVEPLVRPYRERWAIA